MTQEDSNDVKKLNEEMLNSDILRKQREKETGEGKTAEEKEVNLMVKQKESSLQQTSKQTSISEASDVIARNHTMEDCAELCKLTRYQFCPVNPCTNISHLHLTESRCETSHTLSAS